MDNSKITKATEGKDIGSKDKTSNNASNYRYNPEVDTPNPKATKNKAPSSGNIRGV